MTGKVTLDYSITKLKEFKRMHYQEIFQHKSPDVYPYSGLGILEDEFLVRNESDKIVGSVIYEQFPYNLIFRNFIILDNGFGYGKALIKELERKVGKLRHKLRKQSDFPKDIDIWYLSSIIYMDDTGVSDHSLPIFKFGQFLKHCGFKPYKFNKHTLSREESEALKAYGEVYPQYKDNLCVFRKKVVGTGVTLRPDIQEELRSLNRQQWDTVMSGLDWKLGNYNKSGRVSYRYDLCPVCKDMGSSEMNSESCKKCYIHKMCMEPFRSPGKFKYDYEISHAYFSEVERFMIQNRPRGSLVAGMPITVHFKCRELPENNGRANR